MSIDLRLMKETDVPRVAEIERICFSDPWSEAELGACFHKPFYTFLVAEEEGAVAGYVGLITVLDEGDIANVAVAPEFRRRGLAEALLRKLLADGEAAGLRKFFLEVREHNAPAVALYEKLGFRRIGLRKDYYEHPRENALIYGKESDNT